MRPAALLAAALCALCALWSRPALAHKPSDAHVKLTAHGERLHGRIDLAVRDLDAALELDGDGDGDLTWRELSASAPRIAAYVTSRLTLATGGAPCPLHLGDAAIVDLSDGAYWAIPLEARCPRPPQTLELGYALLFDVDALHRGLVHVGGHTEIVRDARPIELALDAPTSIPAFIGEGVRHIWAGLDHLLFLACLILPAVFPRQAKGWAAAASLGAVGREVLEIVTAFTLAHSITLVIAAVGLVSVPSRLVETAIALSVLAAAVNNLVRAIDARWAVAFALGLLHGFGFSSVLLDLGLPSDELVGALLGFNLGVELGQAAVVAVLVPTLFWIRRTLAYQALLWLGSGAVAVLAGVWSVQRWFG